jgi:hypothetical protein
VFLQWNRDGCWGKHVALWLVLLHIFLLQVDIFLRLMKFKGD